MPVKGQKHTPEARERIRYGTRRALAVKREQLRTRARDVAMLRSGRVPVSEAVLPHLEAAEAELAGFLDALGGADEVTPQRRAVLEDVARLGVALRSELARYAETRDPDCASRLSSLTTARRSGLAAVGLDRVTREVSLHEYIAARAQEPAQGGSNGSSPPPGPAEGKIARESARERASWPHGAAPGDGPDTPAAGVVDVAPGREEGSA